MFDDLDDEPAHATPADAPPHDRRALPQEGRSRRRGRRHHGKRRILPRQRVRFTWWQLWLSVPFLLLAAALIVALQPWRTPEPPAALAR